MSSNRRIRHATTVIVNRADSAATSSERTSDAEQLARESAKSYEAFLKQYKSAMRDSPDIPPDGHLPDTDDEKAILEKPPELRSFEDVEWMARKNPQLAHEMWEQTKEIAASDLDSGWMSARTVEALNRSAWERACFLAIRSRLLAAWPPRNPGEMLLIDELVQYEILRRHWVSVLTKLLLDRYLVSSMTNPPREVSKQSMTMAQAAVEASRMVERMQRLYQNTLRSLMHMRKDKTSGKMNVPVPIAVVVAREGERREEKSSCDSAI